MRDTENTENMDQKTGPLLEPIKPDPTRDRGVKKIYQSDTIREITISEEQVELIKNSIAKGATEEELKLYFYDCRRRHVHPLDRLIHFTKRGGKYTPITSIDFMRQRAHQTGECAGIDDAVFQTDRSGKIVSATVTVYRFVQGQRCAFVGTARWSEYCPEPGQDFMWQKMPHGQLGKCAEVIALRKGFPEPLSGLYATEEMDQAYAYLPKQKADESMEDFEKLSGRLLEFYSKDIQAANSKANLEETGLAIKEEEGKLLPEHQEILRVLYQKKIQTLK